MFKICLKPPQQGMLNVFTQGLGRFLCFTLAWLDHYET